MRIKRATKRSSKASARGINVEVPEDLHEKLRKLAFRENATIKGLVVEFVAEGLRRLRIEGQLKKKRSR